MKPWLAFASATVAVVEASRSFSQTSTGGMNMKHILLLCVLAAVFAACLSFPQYPSLPVSGVNTNPRGDAQLARTDDSSMSQYVTDAVKQGSETPNVNPAVSCKTHGHPLEGPPLEGHPLQESPLAFGVDPSGFMGRYYAYPFQANIQHQADYPSDNFRTQPIYQAPVKHMLQQVDSRQQPEYYQSQPESLQRRHNPDLDKFMPRFQIPFNYPFNNDELSTPYGHINGIGQRFRYQVPGSNYLMSNQGGHGRPMPGYLVPGYEGPSSMYDQAWAAPQTSSFLVHYPTDPEQAGSVLIFDQEDFDEEGRPVGGGHNAITKFCRFVGGHQLGKICKKITRPILG